MLPDHKPTGIGMWLAWHARPGRLFTMDSLERLKRSSRPARNSASLLANAHCFRSSSTVGSSSSLQRASVDLFSHVHKYMSRGAAPTTLHLTCFRGALPYAAFSLTTPHDGCQCSKQLATGMAPMVHASGGVLEIPSGFSEACLPPFKGVAHAQMVLCEFIVGSLLKSLGPPVHL